jgi:hypothetical protein
MMQAGVLFLIITKSLMNLITGWGLLAGCVCVLKQWFFSWIFGIDKGWKELHRGAT